VFNQGRIEQVGAPMDLYSRPANTFVAQFLGSPKINVLTYSVDAENQRMVFDECTSLACGQLGIQLHQLQQGRQIGVRPEALRICPLNSGGIRGVIEFTEQLGDACIVYVRLPWHAGLLTVKLSQQQIGFRTGDPIDLQLEPDQFMLFDGQGKRMALN
jgi:ABC-type sugar transport system ATPase subunit